MLRSHEVSVLFFWKLPPLAPPRLLVCSIDFGCHQRRVYSAPHEVLAFTIPETVWQCGPCFSCLGVFEAGVAFFVGNEKRKRQLGCPCPVHP